MNRVLSPTENEGDSFVLRTFRPALKKHSHVAPRLYGVFQAGRTPRPPFNTTCTISSRYYSSMCSSCLWDDATGIATNRSVRPSQKLSSASLVNQVSSTLNSKLAALQSSPCLSHDCAVTSYSRSSHVCSFVSKTHHYCIYNSITTVPFAHGTTFNEGHKSTRRRKGTRKEWDIPKN